MNVLIQSGGGGVVAVRVLGRDGRELRSLYQGYLGAGETPSLAWDTTDAGGMPAASGIYYVVATQSNGRAIVRKVLVVR